MKIISKLRFFFKKLKLKESKYNLLVHKANCYDNMISCVHISIESESIDAKNGKGNFIICRFEHSKNCVCSINISDMLNAGGFTFAPGIKWNITTGDNN